jgi:hypothetical protein
MMGTGRENSSWRCSDREERLGRAANFEVIKALT